MSIYDYLVVGGITLIDPDGYIELSCNKNHPTSFRARLYRRGVKRGDVSFAAGSRDKAFTEARRQLAPESIRAT